MTSHRATPRERLDRLRSRLALPLFVKELVEASSRRRTYVVRTCYAGLLFVLAVLFARDVLFPSGDPFAVLGRGGELYATVMLIQFGGVYLFLPALTAASITAEKERNTLGLLFLTRLSPTKIVLEKYLGRIFPMLCLVLLSLPLLAVAYNLGGLDGNMLFEGVARLAATILMIGAIGVACSAWCRTTAGAFLTAWAILALLFPGPLFVAIALGMQPNSGLIRELGGIGVDLKLWNSPEGIVFPFFGPYSLLEWLDGMRGGSGMAAAFLARPVWVVLWQTTPLLLVTVVALVAARLTLVARAEVKPKRYLARLFKSLDSRFRDWNDRYAKGIEVIKTRGSLPDYAPVAWRETTKTSLGSFRYLVRLLLLVEVPVLFIGTLAAGSYDAYSAGALGSVAGLLWLASGLLLTVKGAGLFSGERARQTLDVLLTTPMTTRSIVREKFAGVWRLIAVCFVPLATTYALIAYMVYGVLGGMSSNVVLYLFVATTINLTHLALAAWLATLIGLRVSTQSRAMLTSVAILVTLCLTGPLLRLIAAGGSYRYEGFSLLSLYSPAAIVGELIGPRMGNEDLVALWVGNLLLYGVPALTLRWVSYATAPRHLGRNENVPWAAPERTVVVSDTEPVPFDEQRAAAEVTA